MKLLCSCKFLYFVPDVHVSFTIDIILEAKDLLLIQQIYIIINTVWMSKFTITRLLQFVVW